MLLRLFRKGLKVRQSLIARYECHTELDLDACQRRLRELSRTPKFGDNFFPIRKPGEVTCVLKGTSFKLFATGHRFTGNPFAPYFFRNLESTRLGTVARGRFGMHRLVWIGFSIWYAVFVVTGLATMIMFLLQHADEHLGDVAQLEPVFGLLLGLTLIVFPNLLIAIGLLLRQGQYRRLEEFLEQCFESQ